MSEHDIDNEMFAMMAMCAVDDTRAELADILAQMARLEAENAALVKQIEQLTNEKAVLRLSNECYVSVLKRIEAISDFYHPEVQTDIKVALNLVFGRGEQ